MSTKISFCVVCMNRLHQLKETLPLNILENSDYENLEFIVLDYNSQDGLEKWVFENLNQFIKSGKVTYYRTPDPLTFSHSHSKNMAFKLATGDIVCNINADHYTGRGFAEYVNSLFTNECKIVITPIDMFKTQKDYFPPTDVMGKVCVRKEDFYEVTGFDENMGNYGFEDCDFVNRLELNGLKRSFIKDRSFLKYISHSNEERYSTNKLTEGIYSFYVSYETPSVSNVLFLYKNNTYESGTLIDNSSVNSGKREYSYKDRDVRYEFSLTNDKLENGTWAQDASHILISGTKLIKSQINGNHVLQTINDNKTYYQISQPESLKEMLTFIYQYSSRAIMEQNLAEKRIKVNKTYGKGTIYKNFDSKNPIDL